MKTKGTHFQLHSQNGYIVLAGWIMPTVLRSPGCSKVYSPEQEGGSQEVFADALVRLFIHIAVIYKALTCLIQLV